MTFFGRRRGGVGVVGAAAWRPRWNAARASGVTTKRGFPQRTLLVLTAGSSPDRIQVRTLSAETRKSRATSLTVKPACGDREVSVATGRPLPMPAFGTFASTRSTPEYAQGLIIGLALFEKGFQLTG
jgi:hypothetical protein